MTRDDVEQMLADGKHNFVGDDLSGLDLSGIVFPETVNFREVKLVGADLRKSRLRNIYLSRANLQGAILSDADLQGACFFNSNLSSAVLTRANLSGASLSNADLSSANLYGARLVRAKLAGANLHGANLAHTELTEAVLASVNLICANLEGANLYDARLTFSNMAGVIGKPQQAYCRLDFDGWSVCVYPESTQIGCITRDNEFWLSAEPDSAGIRQMHSGASIWFDKYGATVKAAIRAVMADQASRQKNVSEIVAIT